MPFKNHLVFLILAVVFSFFALIPVFYRFQNTPASYVYLGAEKYHPDYYLYLNFIKQGVNGHLTMRNDYTSEPIKRTIVHSEYLLIGWVGKMLNLSSFMSFHASRFFLNFIFALVTFWFLNIFIKNKIILVITSFLSFFYTGPPTDYFFSPPNFFQRASLDQHHLLGAIFTILTMGLFLKFSHEKISWLKLFIIGICAGALSYFFTTGILVLLPSIFLFILFYKTKNNIFLFITLCLFSLPILAYIYYIFISNPSLVNIGNFEKYFARIDAQEPFVKIISSYLWFFWPLLLVFFIEKTLFLVNTFYLKPSRIYPSSYYLLIFYLIVHFFFYLIFFQMLDISRMRMFRLPFVIFTAPVTYFGLKIIYETFQKSQKKISSFLLGGFILFLVFFSFKNSLPVWQKEFDYGLKPIVDEAVFLPKKTFFALNYLTNFPENEVVLAPTNLAAFIPGVSTQQVYAGHSVNTISFNGKKTLVDKFFSEEMTSQEAENFIKESGISLILSPKSLDYTFLKVEKKLDNFFIYKVSF